MSDATPNSKPPPPPPRPHVAPIVEGHSQRERFDATELATVLSHYDVGVIEQVRSFPRGSRRSPKVRIRSKRGEFVLKRRAPGQDDPYRVAFAHDLQLRLGQRGYPVAGLIGTRDSNNSMLQLNGRTYELFNYVHGSRYDGSRWQASAAGVMLGRLHALLAGYTSRFSPKTGSYHGAVEIDATMALVPAAVATVEPQADRGALQRTGEFLRQAYKDAAARVDEGGFRKAPRALLHGDWHPGNLLFREQQEVAGVLDFDSARTEPRVIDVANATLQFSLRMTDAHQPASWPDGVNAVMMQALVHGYDKASGQPLSESERAALPWLMIEALVVESVVPIAATGSFSRIAGSAFLDMIERKVRWIAPRAAELVNACR